MTPEEKVWTQYNFFVSTGHTAIEAADLVIDLYQQEKECVNAALRLAYSIKNLARQE